MRFDEKTKLLPSYLSRMPRRSIFISYIVHIAACMPQTSVCLHCIIQLMKLLVKTGISCCTCTSVEEQACRICHVCIYTYAKLPCSFLQTNMILKNTRHNLLYKKHSCHHLMCPKFKSSCILYI